MARHHSGATVFGCSVAEMKKPARGGRCRNSGHIFTPVYHACDVGMGTVTFGNHGNPVVDLLPGQDQTGDPFLIDGAGMQDQVSRMWVTDVYNPTGHATIGMATHQGPLSGINCPL